MKGLTDIQTNEHTGRLRKNCIPPPNYKDIRKKKRQEKDKKYFYGLKKVSYRIK